MEKVIVFGLGKYYLQHAEEISERYDVIGVSDSNGRLSEKFSNFIYKNQVWEYCRKFHCKILLTIADESMAHSIYNELNLLSAGELEQCNSLFEYYPYVLLENLEKYVHFISYGDMDFVTKQIFWGGRVSYCELGVWSPIVNSNTYQFYKNDLGRGILVDANPEIEKWVKKYRPEDTFVNAAVVAAESDAGERVPFYIAAPDRSCSSLSREWIENYTNGNGVEKIYDINTITINKILCSYGADVDFLSVDLEGYDFTVVQSIDFEVYRPKVIQIEVIPTQIGDVIKFFLEKKYICYTISGVNYLFVDSEKVKL